MDAAVQEPLAARMLELARRIEGMRPVDVSCAEEHLMALHRVVEQAQRQYAADGFSGAQDSGARLCSLVARISDDVAGGHVVAVGGLERQVRCYLRRRAEAERARLH